MSDDDRLEYQFAGAEIVSVIASFSTDCRIRPLYVRINGESIKVHTSRVVETSFTSMVFECMVQDYDTERMIHLLYKNNRNEWRVIYK